MPSLRQALAIFTGGSAVLAFAMYWGHSSLVAYCEDSPEVNAGGDTLSCLEPQHWLSVGAGLLIAGILELALVIVVVGLSSRSDGLGSGGLPEHAQI